MKKTCASTEEDDIPTTASLQPWHGNYSAAADPTHRWRYTPTREAKKPHLTTTRLTGTTALVPHRVITFN